MKRMLICMFTISCVVLMSGFAGVSASAASRATYIGKDAAKSTALEHADLTEGDVTFIKTKLDYEDGKRVYDVEFYSESSEYDYEIDAYTGEILSYDYDVEKYSAPGGGSRPPQNSGSSGSGTGQYIGEAAAKSAALSHAGVTESEVTFIKSKLDYDDGRRVYDVEFYKDGAEYDYEIDAYTGKILSYDYDIENYSATPPSSGSGDYIGLEAAKDIALGKAKLEKSQVTFTEASLERDDGMMVYQIGFVSGDKEYEVEVNAVTGAVIDYDVDSRWD